MKLSMFWFLEWVESIVFLYAVYQIVTKDMKMWPIIIIIIFIILLFVMANVLSMISSTMRLKQPRSLFLYTGSGITRRIHFRELDQRVGLTHGQIRKFIEDMNTLRDQNVKRVFAETIIDRKHLEFLGFERVAPSSPLTYIFTVFETLRRQNWKLEKRDLHYCWLYVYEIPKSGGENLAIRKNI